ncbi:MAG: stage V sporulation T C-terminal domain-containing protein [Oscillospiraceae bacterium]
MDLQEIFPIGELGDFAAQICDSLRKTTDGIAAVCDRDTVIAIAGGAKKGAAGKARQRAARRDHGRALRLPPQHRRKQHPREHSR